MRKILNRLLFAVSVAILTAGCSDELVDASGNSGDNGGMQFEMTTEEMGHEVVSMGGTRAGAAMGTPSESDRFLERTLQGDNPYGLKVVRQPLPLIGFNQGAVKAGCSEDSEITRAGANETVTGFTNFHDSLTIWGYTDGGTELFDQIILTKVRNWRNSVEWPYNQGNYMKFYAIAPSLESINMLATGGNFSAAPTFTYTLPEKPNELIDVLYGESENISITAGPAGTTSTNPKEENMGKDNKHVSLQFRHITTAVRFSQGTIPSNFRITSISIVGSRTVGTYNPGTTDAATATQGTWTYADGAATRTYTVSADHTGTGSAGSTDVPITGTPTLFLLPQTLPSGATLQVTLTDTKGTVDTGDDREHILTCSLEGDVWKKGFTVDYKITIGRVKEGYYLNLDGSSLTTTEVEVEHSTNAVSSTLHVYSYQLFYDYSSGTGVPSYTAVTWEIDGVSATGGENDYVPWASKPSSLSWLTDFRGVSSGSVYEGGYSATASFTLAGQNMKYSTEHAIVLSENSKTAASGLDLSRFDPNGVAYANRETANCYIVNRTGSYTFPLFYGNMTSDNNSQKACFKDHKGATITHYDIKSQLGAETPTECASKGASQISYLWSATEITEKNIEPTVRAVLLWQDVSGMITEVTPLLTGEDGKGIIQFQVGISQPGNAVIALQVCKVNFTGTFDSPSGITYGDWETAWTWHIWMTDEVYANDGKDDEVSHDAFYVNGSKTKAKANHIAQLKSGDKTYEILPVDLGWVPDASTFGLYEKRSVWVRLKQTGSDNKAIVKITQHARQDLYTGTGTVYQWGRPTAFPALRNLSGGVRNVYNGSGNITSKFVLAQATSGAGYGGDAISNTFGVLQWETNPNSWFDVNSADYATANAMWNSETKTVYDPCPPGFRVPPASVFYGFSKKEGDTGSAKTIEKGTGNEAGMMNMWPEAQDLNGVTQKNGVRSKGGYFYCKANETNRYGDMVYMPATGEWHGNKSVGTQLQEPGEQLNQTNGLFWTSDYNNDDKDSKACLLWITPEYTFSAGTADKPVIGFFDAKKSDGTVDATNKLNYYSNLRGIRPMKIKIE